MSWILRILASGRGTILALPAGTQAEAGVPGI